MQPFYISARAAISGARFDVVAYRGGALRLNGWELPVVVDLAGLTPARRLIANLDHDSTQRCGHCDKVENDGRELRLGGVLSAATEYAAEVLESHKKGFEWQASIEVSPEKVDEIKNRQNVQVNGQSFTGPIYVTRTGLLLGFAFVSHGADRDTHVSIAARRLLSRETEPESCIFNDRTTSRIAAWLK